MDSQRNLATTNRFNFRKKEIILIAKLVKKATISINFFTHKSSLK